ncbi:MAG: uracil-DNA glycosylase [Candidatus Parvarchaeota archaeon]|nr:uracil-DNA glycosylase [Candidatus Parvarchaeota archaeon]
MESLESISSKIISCKLCDLCKSRKNAVPGEGKSNAYLLIIGEAPGRYEDDTGRPFVGMSGKFLNKYLEMVGIERSETFITNAVKCRPPNNRKPLDKEIDACRPYLLGQMSSIKPKLILGLGTSACNSLGIKYKHLSEVRGRKMHMEFYGLEVDVFITFHPSFPMRFKSQRDKFLEDLKKVKALISD